MTPSISINYSQHVGWVNPKPSSHCASTELPAVRFVKSPAFQNYLLGNFCISITRTITIHPSPLGDHVLHVVFLSSKKQVKRIAARWIITFMKNLKIIRFFVVGQLKGNSVGTCHFSPAVFVSPFSSANTITRFTSAFYHPWPALIKSSYLNFKPKISFPIFGIISPFVAFTCNFRWLKHT